MSLHHSKAVIIGCLDTILSVEERNLFARTKPLGFILFARNIESHEQIRKLCADLRDSVGWYAPILIDQEGGRVARLREPLVPESKPFEFFGDLYKTSAEVARKALVLNTIMQSIYLKDLGINVNCSPVVDLRIDGAHDIIGNRSFGFNGDDVAYLSDIVATTFLENGVLPIAKHLPGHGRALSDSHEELPTLDHSIEELNKTDFAPFKALAKNLTLKQNMWGMVAHILYSKIDPILPATLSKKIVDEILRDDLGYEGVLIADDIGMEALNGSYTQRGLDTLLSGLDATLACNPTFDQMVDLLENLPVLTPESAKRFELSLKSIETSSPSKPLTACRDVEAELNAIFQATLKAA